MPKQGPDQTQIQRILWIALTISILIYGVVLNALGKAQYLALPEETLSQWELLSVAMNCLVLVTFALNKFVITSIKEPQKRFTLYIICWSLNEMVAMAGFMVTFMSASSNGYYFFLNAFTAIMGNIATFPRDPAR